MEITSEDVALPKLKIGQYMSDAVKNQLVKPGAIFTTTGDDDPDPQVLWDPNKKDPGPGVVIYVVSMWKGKSLTAEGGGLDKWTFNDPSAPPEAWVTYNYTVVIPSFDTEVPVKWLLTRTGRPAAQAMNTVIKKNEGRGPAWTNAFQVTTAKRENTKGEFFVPRVSLVEAKADDVAIAEKLAVMVSGSSADVYATGDEPAI